MMASAPTVSRLTGLDTTAPIPRVCASFGMGLDSTAMLLRWLTDASSRDFELADLVVLTAMTGHEFAATTDAVSRLVLPLLARHRVRFIQVARCARTTTRVGDGVVILDDSSSAATLFAHGDYTLGQEMLAAGTVPQRGGIRACSMHAKGDCLDPVIARITAGHPYRHAIGFEANESGRAAKDRTYNTATRTGWYGVALVTERNWLFSWSFGRGLRMTFAPGRFGVGEGVEHQLAPGERRVDRELCVPDAETNACGCRTVSGAHPAVAQLGKSIGDGCDRAQDALNTFAAIRSGTVRGVQSERKLCCAR